MEDRRPDKSIDELLDASLQRYRSEEPRAGLEDRILANVRTRDLAGRRRAWTFALAGTAAALAMIAVVLHVPRRPSATASKLPRVSVSRPAPAVVAPRQTLHQVARRVPKSPAAPRRPEQFPTPAGLSEQERLLLAYVAANRGADLSNRVIRDLTIDPLQFPEIEIARIEIKEIPESIE